MKTDKSGRVEFIEEEHLYLMDGCKVLPSVTQLMHKIPEFAGMYDNVDPIVLKKKAQFGSNVHYAIEQKGQNGVVSELTLYEQLCVDQYDKLVEKYNICPIENEMIIHYKDIYAGTLDMIADINYTRTLADIKTTATLNRSYLEWQLGFYLLALKDMGLYTEIKDCAAIHLPKKDVGKLINITPKREKEILKFLEQNGYAI